MRPCQRGVSLLIPVLFIMTVAAFGLMVAASQSGGDIQATDAQADSVEALLLAETGLERAIKRFATGTACNALGETITNLTTIGLGASGRTITIGNGLTTDFSSVALRSLNTQCRVPVSGKIDATNVTRTLHAIIDKNLLAGVNNFNFDNPAAAGVPSGWTLTPATGYADNGGPDGTAPACSRSAWLVKTSLAAGGAASVNALGQANVNFTVTGGSTTTVYFHWRISNRGPNGACAAGAGAGPGFFCLAGTANDGGICFITTEAGFANPSYSGTLGSNATVTNAVGCPDAGTIRSAFNPCQTSYQAGYPTKVSLTATVTGAGTRTIAFFFFNTLLQNAARREMYLDQIEVVNNTALGVARVQDWRDCSMSNCP